MKNQGKALITGASAGIGAVYADRLAKRGFDLILVARDESRLQKLAGKLSSETGQRVEVLRADLTQKSDLVRVEEVLKTDPEITLLVNNAGFFLLKPLLESDADQLEEMIALNVTALTRLSSAAVPALVKRRSGGIINIASIVALTTDLIDATYSASKAYVLNFTQFIQHELRDTGIQVQAVLPGVIASELWQRAGMDIGQLPNEMVMSAEDMVDASLVDFDQKELVTIPSLPNIKDWEALEAARAALRPNLSRSHPAPRYLDVIAA
jgi:short-subunit dehydrogenase